MSFWQFGHIYVNYSRVICGRILRPAVCSPGSALTCRSCSRFRGARWSADPVSGACGVGIGAGARGGPGVGAGVGAGARGARTLPSIPPAAQRPRPPHIGNFDWCSARHQLSLPEVVMRVAPQAVQVESQQRHGRGSGACCPQPMDSSESSLRTISAPPLNAPSLARATARGKGAIPQLVDAQSLSGSTN